MKIVSFEEFCKLPDGTIFSYWEPSIATGLFRRGIVLGNEEKSIDFYEASLIAQSYEGNPPECELSEMRWGMYNYNQMFLVYEPADIAVIMEGLGAIRPQIEED